MTNTNLMMAVRRLKDVADANEQAIARSGPTWRHEYIRNRRTFMETMGDIRGALQSEGPRDGSAPVQLQLRRLTTALALHQADWPVVAINLSSSGYMESMDNVRRQLAAFLAIADAHMGAPARQPAAA